jgi:hypothetical protein
MRHRYRGKYIKVAVAARIPVLKGLFRVGVIFRWKSAGWERTSLLFFLFNMESNEREEKAQIDQKVP